MRYQPEEAADTPRWGLPRAVIVMLGMAGAVIVVAGTAAFATLLTELLPLAADRRTHPGDDLLSFICGTPAARGAAWSRPSFRMPPGPGGWLTISLLSVHDDAEAGAMISHFCHNNTR